MNRGQYLVEMKNISKSFGKVVALNGVDFYVRENEVVGLVGDNGAGKSTLVNILAGLHAQDSGEIYVKGRLVTKHTVKKARELGIEAAYQTRSLVENQTLWRNVFIGREITDRIGFLKIGTQKMLTDDVMRQMGFKGAGLSSDAIVGTMSGGEQQGAIIARALYFKSDLVILDEPTRALSITESDKVLDDIRGLKKKGRACIFITHNIYHVYPVADRFVILDRGEVKAEFENRDVSLENVIDRLRAIAR